MESELYEDFDYINDIARQIKAVLAEDSSLEPFTETVVEYFNTESAYPDDLTRKLQDILESHAPDLVKPFRGIVLNEDCPENAESLFTTVFFNQPDAEEEAEEYPEQPNDDIVIEAAPIKEVERVKTTDSIWRQQQEQARNAAEIISVSEDVAYLLLQSNGWNEDGLYASFAENRGKMLAAIGLKPEQGMESLSLQVLCDSDELETCNVCFEDVPQREMMALACDHYFCEQCWRTHIEEAIKSGAHVLLCQEEGCQCRVLMSDVERLCGEQIAENYRLFIIENQIAVDPLLRHCLNPTCKNVLTLHSVGLCNVATCTCGQRLCWKCREEAHAPLSCDLVKKWRMVTKEEVMQAKWIVENTKPCPKCASRIEKNGGCNHMTCRTSTGGGCGYEFCWICGHEWKTHVGNGYSCNRYVDFDTLDKAGVPEGDLKRLDHYHTRYQNHKRSHEVELKVREQQRRTLLEHLLDPRKDMVLRVEPEKAERLATDVFQAIDTARSVLIWSYPHAFYMAAGSVELNLFEHVQTEVERYLEQLTDIVENRPWLNPNEFETSAKILAANTNVLNRHVDQHSH